MGAAADGLRDDLGIPNLWSLREQAHVEAGVDGATGAHLGGAGGRLIYGRVEVGLDSGLDGRELKSAAHGRLAVGWRLDLCVAHFCDR